MTIGESYRYSPRVTSTHRRTIFEELEKIANNVDFRNAVFKNRFKRNRSLGSAQAIIVELALTDEVMAERLQHILRGYMVEKGRHWHPTVDYRDKY